jgi:hypothetical protein
LENSEVLSKFRVETANYLAFWVLPFIIGFKRLSYWKWRKEERKKCAKGIK